MPNLFESAERLYKRISAGNQRYTRKQDARSNDGTSLSSPNALGNQATATWTCKPTSKSEVTNHNLAPQASPRLLQPPGDLTAVSSESDDEEEGGGMSNAASRHPIESRNQRLRQSIQRAKAADFETSGDTQNRYPSAERLYSQAAEAFDNEKEGKDDDDNSGEGDEESADEDEAYDDADRIIDNKQARDEEDTSENIKRSFLPPQVSQTRAGIRWSSDPPLPLVDILPKIRRGLSPPCTEFVRAFCQRQSCRCLLRGHDTLMLFPLFDAVLCESTWEKTKESQLFSTSASPRSATYFLSRLQHGHSSGVLSETQANLIMFRQCRGWYEVMNENHEPVPHWTTTEEVRIAKPSTFLVRRDQKCLLAPHELWMPPNPRDRIGSNLNSLTSNNDIPPPIPVPSKIIVEAANPKTIAASTPYCLKPGMLLSYVDYLHDCTVSRGKKLKQISLILAVEKLRIQRLGEPISTPRRLFYIGTEETSSQAVFPNKLTLSPIAGPENISGVHTLSTLLRKFRLPLSIVPVAVPEKKNPLSGSTLSSDSDSTNYATAQSSKSVNIFPTVPGITFTDRSFIRLRKLLRGDIMIVAPVDAPDRFFLITPTLLQNHLFQLGFTEDDRYQRLAVGHRNRTINFISMAHPRESLDYLLVYLKNITNRPRMVSVCGKDESAGRELWNRLKAGVLQPHEITPAMARAMYADTGKDPRTGPACDLTPEEMDLMCDEMEDLYFFTRNGFFPPKSRLRRMKSNLGASQSQLQNQPYVTTPKLSSCASSAIPSAEQLLAASLNISANK